jgi:hypothetical protein
MSDVLVDVSVLREQVREKCREVATEPGGAYHFHTGRLLAARLGYPTRPSMTCPILRWSRSRSRPVPVAAMRDVDLWTG